MRWESREARAKRLHGTTRTRARFAWLPVTVAGERVWLERYQVTEVFVFGRCPNGYSDEVCNCQDRWAWCVTRCSLLPRVPRARALPERSES